MDAVWVQEMGLQPAETLEVHEVSRKARQLAPKR